MKENYRYLNEFILDQRSFFEDVLLPSVNEGANSDNLMSWETNVWNYDGKYRGFLAQAKNRITFHEIKCNRIKNIYKEDEPKLSLIEINPSYRDFMKAYAVSLNRNSLVSTAVVYEQVLLLKRIYIRMHMSGTGCHPTNITSDFLQDATDMMAESRTGNSAKSNASKDYDVANVIANNLNYFALTLTQLDVSRKVKSIGNNYTKEAKSKGQNEGEVLEEEKNLSIHTFLNIVALRSKVQTDGEKIILNLVMLLIVTGFRHMEAALINFNDYKVVEIGNKETKALMEKRGLPTFYVGIKYQGEKGAGLRTHWVEPLAVDLVESIWVDTITLNEKLRVQIEYLRTINFKSLLPKNWQDDRAKKRVVEIAPKDTVDLDEIVMDVYESYAQTVLDRGLSSARDYAKKKLQNSDLSITPYSVVNLDNYNSKTQHYLMSDIERFLRSELEQDRNASTDLIHRLMDSATGHSYEKPFENLLFIIPKGSGAPSRAGALKVIPEIIHKSVLQRFLGYGAKGNEKRSIFAKYKLIEEDGEFTSMSSHVPRHGINTFFSLAGVSEHLQAIFMGRKDLSQNKKYQHLALEDRVISSELVTFNNTDSAFKEHTALEAIKQQATIGLNQNLSLQNSIVQSMHSHTTQGDKVSFVVDMIEHSESHVFSEWGDVLDLLNDEEKNDIVTPHSDLAIMDIGSCMRKLKLFQCPYNMKCQDGTQCPYFTLTGRTDESSKISLLADRINIEITTINEMKDLGQLTIEECEDILEELHLRRENIKYHLSESKLLESEKIQINLMSLDRHKKPKMLSSLFALEQRNIEKMSDLKRNQ